MGHGLLIAAASPAVQRGLQGASALVVKVGVWAQSSCSRWYRPRPGVKLHSLHWQTDPQALDHPASPITFLMCFCSVAQLCPTLCNPMGYCLPGPSVHGFYRQEYWSRLPFPTPEVLPDPGIEHTSPEPPGKLTFFNSYFHPL